jgi:hypothetical protein
MAHSCVTKVVYFAACQCRLKWCVMQLLLPRCSLS